MKNNPLFFVLFCIGIFVINSCKTDTKTKPDTKTVTKESTVIVRLAAETDNLNPFVTISSHNTQVMYYMFPTVLDVDPFTLKLSPVLAKSNPVIEEIKEGDRKGWVKYNYELLDEAVWDDGSPITGHDYLYTMKALFNPHAKTGLYQSYLDLIKDIEVDSENPKKYTVFTNEKYIKAEFATGLFILPQYKYDPDKVLANYKFGDMRNAALAEQFEKDEALIAYGEKFNSPEYLRGIDFVGGCGAYKVEEWVAGERLVLVKKDNWWGDKVKDKNPMLTANPKRIIFKPVPDATTALTMMKNQELDVGTTVPDDQFNEFRDSELGKEFFNFYTPSSLGYSYFGLNTKGTKLNDKRTRRALAHLLDIDEIFKSVKPYAEPIVGPFHPLRPYYHKGLKPITLDVGNAKKLLKEAGWNDSNNNGTVDKTINGELVELELDILIVASSNQAKSLALIFQNQTKEAGVRINIVEKEASALISQIGRREFDIYVLGTGAEVLIDDPKQFWHTASDVPRGSNRFGFGNAESDKLIDEIRRELDPVKRNAQFKKLQEIIYDEQPAIFLYATKDRVVINKKYDGAKTSLKKPGYFVNYWFEK